MPDETVDTGNQHLIEGGEDIMSAIDSVFEATPSTSPPDTQRQATTDDQQQDRQQATETPEQTAQRTRDEQGRFQKEQQAAKDKAAADASKTQQQATATNKDTDYPAEIKSPKAREHFDTVKRAKEEATRRAESAETKLKQYETRIQELESKSGTAAPEVKVLQTKVQELEAQLEERERVLSFKAVEETKAFKEGVTEPQKAALGEIHEAVTTYKLDARELDKILQEPSKYKRREMLEDLTADLPERSQFVKEDLRANVEKYVAAEAKASELFNNAKGNREYADQERQQTEAKAALERQQQYQAANKEVDGIMKEKYPEIAGNEEEWRAITEKAFKVADFDRMPPKAKAFANLASWGFLKAMEKLRAETTAHQKTKEIMAKRNGSTPNPTGGRAATGATTTEEEDYDPRNPMGGLMSGIDSVLSGS